MMDKTVIQDQGCPLCGSNKVYQASNFNNWICSNTSCRLNKYDGTSRIRGLVNNFPIQAKGADRLVKSLYTKELQKWCYKKLKHLKKPRIRKRKLVAQMAFAIAVKHKSQGHATSGRFVQMGFVSGRIVYGNQNFEENGV